MTSLSQRWCNFWWQIFDLINWSKGRWFHQFLVVPHRSQDLFKLLFTKGLVDEVHLNKSWLDDCNNIFPLILTSVLHWHLLIDDSLNLSSSKQSAEKVDKPCTWGSPRCRSSFLTKPPPRSTKHVSWLPTTGWAEEHHSRRSSSSCCWIEIIIYQTLLGENYLRRPFLSNTTIQNDK